jgi:cob(I)alamin adenosyltransferase
MKIYTKTGDAGTTSLVGGTRVSKDDARLEAYGTVDELNSWLGLIAAISILPAEDDATLQWLQNKLFNLGALLATEPDSKWQPQQITENDVTHLEAEIDRIDSQLPVHNQFILPGGSAQAANAHIARTVARRAERRMVTLSNLTQVAAPAMKFINRLSDYLFVFARYMNKIAKKNEVFWNKDC